MATKVIKKADQLSNNNYFIVLLLVSLLVVGGAVLIGKSLVSGIVRDTKVLKAKNIANKQLDQNLVAVPQLIDNYATLTNKNIIANALPNQGDLPAFMAMMENMGASSGVGLKSIAPSQVGTVAIAGSSGASTNSTAAGGASNEASQSVKPPRPQPYAVSMTFDANYPALGRLLTAIEQSARPIRVTSLQISGSGASLSVQMEVTTYYQDKAKLPFSMETVK